MSGLFTLSYALLCGLVVIEAVLLREVLRRTVLFKRLHSDFNRSSESEKSKRLPAGSPAPDFTAPLLWTNGSLSARQLIGHPSILMFVSPEGNSVGYKNLEAVIHVKWHETNGHIYLVCSGGEEGCRQLAREHSVKGHAVDTIPVIIDEGGRIAQSFLIDSTPQAVSLDEEGRIDRYGRPIPSEDVEEVESEGDQIRSADTSADTISIDSPSIAEKAHEYHEAGEEPSISRRGRTVGGGDGKPCFWPDERPYTGAAFARMDSTVACVMTRFRLRSTWSLIPFYLAFRRVRRSARDVDGLLQAVFLIEDLRTCYTISLWKDDCSIVDFSSIRAHISAANSAFGPTYRKDLNRAEIWSAQFRLWAVSCHNLNWEGLDLQTELAEQWGRREEVDGWEPS